MTGKPSVAVGMSGGVDSSVAAAILKRDGYRVLGLTMKVFDSSKTNSQEPTPRSARHGCYGGDAEADIEDARRVADVLGIPHHVIDLTAEYEAEVLDYFRREYRLGRTPNPCLRCNPRVKFGALVGKARQSGLTFDLFATGHYARVEWSGGRNVLLKGRDARKDQSYFLAFLTGEQLRQTLLPLGDLTKAAVRKVAADLGLPVAGKAESQDFAPGGFEALLGTGAPGPVLDGAGNVLAEHRGIGHYTIGQRKGLGVASTTPVYVVDIDPERNAVIVGDRQETYRNSLTASGLNWTAIERLEGPIRVTAKVRYRHPEAWAEVNPIANDRVYVKFDEPQLAITPGQGVVFYEGDVVLGGGTIERERE